MHWHELRVRRRHRLVRREQRILEKRISRFRHTGNIQFPLNLSLQFKLSWSQLAYVLGLRHLGWLGEPLHLHSKWGPRHRHVDGRTRHLVNASLTDGQGELMIRDRQRDRSHSRRHSRLRSVSCLRAAGRSRHSLLRLRFVVRLV